VKLVHDIDGQAVTRYRPEDAALLCSIGRLVCAWTMLEQSLVAKIALMRGETGDVRTVGSRTRPTMAKLVTELRTMVAMRDRRNASALTEIAEIECDMQRIDRFRGLIIQGFQRPEPGGFICRDVRNNLVHVSFEQLDQETDALDALASRLLEI